MDLKRWTRNGFALALTCALFAGGLALSTEPAQAAGGGCPINICPSNLNGWTFEGGCTRYIKRIAAFCCDAYKLEHNHPNGTSYCRTNCIDI